MSDKVADKGKAFKSQSRQTALAKTGNSRLKPNSDLPEDQQRALGGYIANGAVYDRAEGVTGTSIFDPVLCELIYRWFCPKDGYILDPFAGGSVRGIVAAKLGYQYTGIDLSETQITANREQAIKICDTIQPAWTVGDSQNIDTLAKGEYDLIFSCPPYYDLEVYSDQQGELSTMSYEDFIKAYRSIIAKCVAMLKDNRFACFVVGDIRDKQGYYRNFVSDTISAFEDAGALLYNEAILVTAVGSLPIRVGRAFQSNRKLGKTHQNVLIFYKGNPKNIKGIYGDVECGDEDTGKTAELIKE